MSAATWTPRTEREREAVVALCVKAIQAWVRGLHAIAERYADDVVPPVPPTPRPTRLREVKLNGYDDLYRWNNGTLEVKVGNPPYWKKQTHVRTDFLDSVAALRDNPTEPAPDAVVEYIRDMRRQWDVNRDIRKADDAAAELRAIVLSEVDAAATVDELVAALVKKGAVRATLNTARIDCRADFRDCLILHPEAST